MRTFVDGNLTVTVPDFGVWVQENNILRAQGESGHRFGISYRSIFAEYTLDENGIVEVDLSDVLRVYPLETRFGFRCSYDGEQTSIEFNFSRAGLINPKNVLIPYDDTLAKILEFDDAELAILNGVLFIVPPSMMYAGVDRANVSFEFNSVLIAEQDYELELDAFVDGSWSGFELSNVCTLPRFSTRYRLHENYIGSTLFDRTLRTFECGKRYAAVRWVSFTGRTRCHTFEVVKANSNTIDSVELLTIDGSYNVVKGREDRFGLRLDNLTAYDLWYYSDVCHSSKVEISMNGTEWQQVDVMTKTVSLPDGDAGKFNTLNVELKWRKYNAVSM